MSPSLTASTTIPAADVSCAATGTRALPVWSHFGGAQLTELLTIHSLRGWRVREDLRPAGVDRISLFGTDQAGTVRVLVVEARSVRLDQNARALAVAA